MHITKKMGCSVNGGNTGYDLSKYTDIEFSSNCSVSYLYLLQLIRYDSILVRSGLISILMTQIGKYIFYMIIELINIFFTRGTGLVIVRSGLFVVVELVLLIDVFYYLNWKDAGRASSFNRKATYLR